MWLEGEVYEPGCEVQMDLEDFIKSLNREQKPAKAKRGRKAPAARPVPQPH